MVEASQRYQVALKNAERLIHMQPVQVNLLQDTALLSRWPAQCRGALLPFQL